MRTAHFKRDTSQGVLLQEDEVLLFQNRKKALKIFDIMLEDIQATRYLRNEQKLETTDSKEKGEKRQNLSVIARCIEIVETLINPQYTIGSRLSIRQKTMIRTIVRSGEMFSYAKTNNKGKMDTYAFVNPTKFAKIIAKIFGDDAPISELQNYLDRAWAISALREVTILEGDDIVEAYRGKGKFKTNIHTCMTTNPADCLAYYAYNKDKIKMAVFTNQSNSVVARAMLFKIGPDDSTKYFCDRIYGSDGATRRAMRKAMFTSYSKALPLETTDSLHTINIVAYRKSDEPGAHAVSKKKNAPPIALSTIGRPGYFPYFDTLTVSAIKSAPNELGVIDVVIGHDEEEILKFMGIERISRQLLRSGTSVGGTSIGRVNSDNFRDIFDFNHEKDTFDLSTGIRPELEDKLDNLTRDGSLKEILRHLARVVSRTHDDDERYDLFAKVKVFASIVGTYHDNNLYNRMMEIIYELFDSDIEKWHIAGRTINPFLLICDVFRGELMSDTNMKKYLERLEMYQNPKLRDLQIDDVNIDITNIFALIRELVADGMDIGEVSARYRNPLVSYKTYRMMRRAASTTYRFNYLGSEPSESRPEEINMFGVHENLRRIFGLTNSNPLSRTSDSATPIYRIEADSYSIVQPRPKYNGFVESVINRKTSRYGDLIIKTLREAIGGLRPDTIYRIMPPIPIPARTVVEIAPKINVVVIGDNKYILFNSEMYKGNDDLIEEYILGILTRINGAHVGTEGTPLINISELPSFLEIQEEWNNITDEEHMEMYNHYEDLTTPHREIVSSLSYLKERYATMLNHQPQVPDEKV